MNGMAARAAASHCWKKPMARRAKNAEPSSDNTGRGRKVLTGKLRGPDLRAAIARNIRKIRRDLGLTQEQMEARTGIDAAYIGAMERADQNITVDSLSNLAAAYGVQPHDLVCGTRYGLPPTRPFTLDILARLTAAADKQAQTLLLKQGPVAVGASTLATLLGALFEAAGESDPYAPSPKSNPLDAS